MSRSPVSNKGSNNGKPRKKPLRTKILSVTYKIQNFFLRVCMSRAFALVIIALIILNTVILALDGYPIDYKRDVIFDKINIFLTWCFFSEMVIKIIGLGITNYIKDKVNIFDAIIVSLTVADSITDMVLYSSDHV